MAPALLRATGCLVGVLYRGGVGQAEVGVRWPGYFRALHNPDIAQECMSLTRARTRSLFVQ